MIFDKYVVFLPQTDVYINTYFELFNKKNVEVIDSILDLDSELLRKMHRVHYSYKLNQVINVPFKNLWYPIYYRNEKTKEKILFLFVGTEERCLSKYTRSYRNYLKNKFPNCIIALFFTDLVELRRSFDINRIKIFADIIIDYDKVEAKKFGFLYHTDVITKLDVGVNTSDEFENYVNFCGIQKNRGELILQIYRKLTSWGINVDFSVPDCSVGTVDENNTLKDLGYIPYTEYLKRLKKSKCILEIMQENAVGYTLRTIEAIQYNKLLISNNEELKNFEFYNPQYMKIIKNSEDIDLNWLISTKNVKYDYENQLTPFKLLEYISKQVMRNDDYK